MMQHYRIILRNERAGSLRKSLWLIAGLNLIYFGIVAFRDGTVKSMALAGLSVLLTLVPYLVYRFKKERPSGSEPGLFALGALAGLQLFNGLWWIGVAIFVIIVLYALAVKTPVLVVNDREVVLDIFPAKKMAWKDLNNIVIKDGLLTIDLRNNKVIQQMVEGSVNESEFNEFCRGRLLAAGF